MSFLFVDPLPVSAAALTSNIVETPPPEFDDQTVYDEGFKASLTSGTAIAVYESRKDGNVGNDPELSPEQWLYLGEIYAPFVTGSYDLGDIVTDVAFGRLFKSQTGANTASLPSVAESSEEWQYLGPTNRRAMFDYQVNAQTAHPERIAVSIALDGRIDTLALLNVSAGAVNIRLLKGETVLVDEDISLVNYFGIADYWDHHFKPVRRKRNLKVTGLPIVSGLTLEVTLTGESVALGFLAVGQARVFGETELGASLGFRTASTIEEDDFLRRTIVKRDHKKEGRFEVWTPSSYVDEVFDVITEYDATGVLVIPIETYSSAIYFGLIRRAEILIRHHRKSVITFVIEDY